MVAYDASSHLVRLEVTARRSLAKPKPGTYYYLHVLDDVRYAHQSHPFTLAYVSTMRRTTLEESTETDPLLASAIRPRAAPTLVFLVRPYDGFTSRLAQKASLRPRSLRVLVEGSYGHTASLRQYQHVLFVVGGTGIAVALSYLEDILSNESAVGELRIVWAVREHAFLASVLQDFRDLLQDERVRLDAYLTQCDEHMNHAVAEEHKRVTIEAERPDVHAVVADAAGEAEHQSLAIMACGPAQMADQARRASVDALANGFRGVDYFEESFKW